jgi:hypothetical protein
VPLIPAATPETLTASDVFNVQNALPPRFQPRPVWHGNLSILNSIRALETTNGAIRFPKLQSNPPMLLSRSVYENSNMDGSLNPAATENNYVLLYGDFAAGMVIVDRFGSTLELVPQLFGSNRRPARRTFVVPHRLRRGDSERTDAVDSDDGLTGRPRNAVPAGNGAAPYRRPVQPLPVPVGVCCATSTRRFAVRASAEPHSGSGSRPRVAGWPEGRREPGGWRLDTSGPEPGPDPLVGP